MPKYLQSACRVAPKRGPVLLSPSLDLPLAPEPPRPIPARYAQIGDEAARLFGSKEIEDIRRCWQLGDRTSSRFWRWLAPYGVKEVLIHEYPSTHRDNLGVGIRLLFVHRENGEEIIATAGDLMLSFIPRWRQA